MASTKLKGNPVALLGADINVGDKAPVVTLVAKDLSEIKVGGRKRENTNHRHRSFTGHSRLCARDTYV